MRYVLFRTYIKAEGAIQAVATPSAALPLNDLSSSLSAGLGFGTMQGIIMYGSVLSASTGPGVLFVDSCPHIPLVLLSAVTCLCFIVMNVVLMVAAFTAYRTHNLNQVAVICGLHLVASLLTVINTYENGCAVSLPLLVCLVGGMTCHIILVTKRAAVAATSRAYN